MSRMFLFCGAVTAFLGVGLGAFGAHGLRDRLDASMLAVYQTGVQYHLIHALGLVAVGVLAQSAPASGALRLSGWCLLLGIVVFSGSLYLLAVTGQRWLGAITPFGGVVFLVGWAALAWAALSGSLR